jgi:hypothetical protein
LAAIYVTGRPGMAVKEVMELADGGIAIGGSKVSDLAESEESVRFGKGDSGALKVSQSCG